MRHPVASGFRTSHPTGPQPGPSSSHSLPICAKPSGAVLRTFLNRAPALSRSTHQPRHSKRLPPLAEKSPSLLASALPRNANDIFYNIPGYEVDRHLTTPFRLQKSTSGLGYCQERAEISLTNAMISDLTANKTPWIVLFRLILTKAGTEELVEDKLKLLSVDVIEINRDVIKLQKKEGIRFHVNITGYTNASLKNTMSVSAKVADPEHANDLDIFCQVSLVRKSSAPQIIQQLMRKAKIPKEETQKLIIDSFKDAVENGIMLSKQPVSLICPLGKTQMTVPCRGYFCNHYTCFDGSNFLQMYAKASNWKCPICDTMIEREELMIDSFFQDILLAVQGKQNVKIEIDSSGEFHSSTENGVAKTQNTKSNETLDLASDEEIVLISDEDEVVVCGEKRKANDAEEPAVPIKRERLDDKYPDNGESNGSSLNQSQSNENGSANTDNPAFLMGTPGFPVIEKLVQVTRLLVPIPNSGDSRTYYQGFDVILTAARLAQLSDPESQLMVVLQLISVNPETNVAFSGDHNLFQVEILRINNDFVQVPIQAMSKSHCFNLDISKFLKSTSINTLGFVTNMDCVYWNEPVMLFCTVGLIWKTDALRLTNRDNVFLPSLQNKFSVIETRELLTDSLDRSIERGIILEASKLPVSLLCPLTGQQMKLPCRSIFCKHFACFDGINFLEMYEGSANKRLGCPICGSRIRLDNLLIDKYFELLLSSLPYGANDSRQYQVHIDKRGSFSYTPVQLPQGQRQAADSQDEFALLNPQEGITENIALLKSNHERIQELRSVINEVALAIANQAGEKVGRPLRARRVGSISTMQDSGTNSSDPTATTTQPPGQ